MSTVTTPASAPLTLEEERAAFSRGRFLAMPLTGAIVWAVIGVCGAILEPAAAVWVLFLGTGSIIYLALFLSRFTGEHLTKQRRNAFDPLFYVGTAQALLVFSIAIPFFQTDYTSLPLSVGILTGLMWMPFSWIIQHWIGIFHSVSRTALCLTAWYLFPDQRFVVIPAIIVAVYAVTIVVLEKRWRVVNA